MNLIISTIAGFLFHLMHMHQELHYMVLTR